jgi:ParB/RepB/Spo0J family partition protein
MTNQSVTWGNGLKVEMMRLDSMRKNPWNPNKMDDETFAKEILSIQNNGFVEPIKVRITATDEVEIIDGEHRWRASQQIGMVEVPVVNLGKISDAQAKKLTIIANELRGSPEPTLLANLIRDLSEGATLEALSLELPMSTTELDALVQSTKVFDWDAIEGGLAATGAPILGGATGPSGVEKKFALANIKGAIASRLADELMLEYNRSAVAVGSTNPETVLRHWLTRLQSTSQTVDQEVAVIQAAQPPTPSKRQRKAAAP